MANSPRVAVTTVESIAGHIYVIRGEQAMVDSDLATLYGVTTSALNQAVTRNAERFPEDFAFKLSPEEWAALKSHPVIPKTGRGGRRKPPRVFTEQGVKGLLAPTPEPTKPSIGFVQTQDEWTAQ